MGLVAMDVRRCPLLACLLALGVCLAGGVVPSASAAPQNVLILSEGPVLPNGVVVRARIVAALRQDLAEPLNIYEESIDRIRFQSEEYDRQLLALYKIKYVTAPPDVVIALTEPALDFALRHRDDLFPNAALVFGAVDERAIPAHNLGPNVTGIFMHIDARLTLEAALTLHPGTRNIVVVGGASRFDRGHVEVVQDDLRDLASPAAITYITGKPLNEILAAVASLGDHGLVLFLSLNADGDGVARPSPDVLEALRQATTAPIYGMSDNYLGHGIVGGVLLDYQRHATELGERARQILAGKRASDLAPTRTTNMLAFDWRELKRFGIDEARLPAGATVVNRDLSVWHVYKWTILLVGAALVGQSLLIVTLMIQRTRRRGVERALRESEERFRLMADTAPVLVWRADTANLCDFVNRPWLEFTGRTMEQESGNGWLEGVWPEDLDRCVRTCVSAFDARQPFRMEFRLRRADGAYRWVLDTGVPRYGPDGSFAGYIGSCLDITDRKDSEDALRDSQERYALATAAGAVGVWDWNLETNDIYVDPTLTSILGFDDTEIANRLDWGSRVHPNDAAAVMAQVQPCIDGDVDAYEVAHRMVHKDGSLRWFLERGSLIRRADGAPLRLVGTDMDITERKRAEEAMRENEAVLQASHREIEDLAGRLIASQEVERARIARDLHDDLSQQLAGLSIALSGVKRRVGSLPGAGDLQGDVSSLQQRTVALAENIRHLSHDLHPSVIEHGGLLAALAAYCAELQRRHTVAVTFSAEGDLQSIAAEIALCLYRVAQEGLRNVVTHADARHAHVLLLRTGDRAELTITDDGRGFDIVQKGKSINGLGLVSINERVRLAGGTVSIVTELHKGTRVRVQVPMNRLATSAVADASGPYAPLA